MNWWKPLAALAVASLVFVGVGGLVGLLAVLLGNVAALAVVGLLAVAVLAVSKLGARSRRWRSNPYW